MQDFTRPKKNSSAGISERQGLANNLKFSMKMFKRGKKEGRPPSLLQPLPQNSYPEETEEVGGRLRSPS